MGSLSAMTITHTHACIVSLRLVARTVFHSSVLLARTARGVIRLVAHTVPHKRASCVIQCFDPIPFWCGAARRMCACIICVCVLSRVVWGKFFSQEDEVQSRDEHSLSTGEPTHSEIREDRENRENREKREEREDSARRTRRGKGARLSST